MNTCYVNMNGYVLPSEIVCEILQRTDCHGSLQFVCKAFAAHFFTVFSQGCESSPSLKDRVTCIELDHPKFSNSQKVKELYEGLRQRVEKASRLCSEDKASQIELLKLKGTSLEELYHLDSWLEDIGLLALFELVAGEMQDAAVCLKSVEGKATSAKAETIRRWLFSNQTNLKAVVGIFGTLSFIEKLTQLPKEIGLFTDVKKLGFSGGCLISLPIEIYKLRQLQELYLYSNRFTNFLIKICNFHQLQKLDLGNNGLTSLPKEIGNLHQLQKLYLYMNKLTSLPEEICDLNQLQTLYLYENQLTSLPDKMGRFKDLKKLQLANNKLSSLPNEISNLNQLEILILQDNQLTSLPEEMRNLSQLRELDIRKNPFTTLPEWVNRLIEAGVATFDEAPED